MMSLKSKIERFWYSNGNTKWIFFPIHLFLKLLITIRSALFKLGVFSVTKIETPVIVIGNITLGGTGKTPFLIWLCERLNDQGLKVGVISRGYGGQAENYPLVINEQTAIRECGDEPKLIHSRTGVPVVVDPDRVRAAKFLQQHYTPDIILSDDGMQHYALARDVEICIVDGYRQLGNGLLTPVGPLREPIARLKRCNLVVQNSGQPLFPVRFTILPLALVNLLSGEQISIDNISFQNCYAVCGIGNPEKFSRTLTEMKLNYQLRAFTDHHEFVATDFDEFQTETVIMTEKDAGKCKEFAGENWWFLKVGIKSNTALDKALDEIVDQLIGSQNV